METVQVTTAQRRTSVMLRTRMMRNFVQEEP
ncbi:hypothetical protein N183_16695 [Sinorhizobium sp. Sb3]|nr:hypothetical protein N183_16695 [Sinorhizobium sp. Sb3]